MVGFDLHKVLEEKHFIIIHTLELNNFGTVATQLIKFERGSTKIKSEEINNKFNYIIFKIGSPKLVLPDGCQECNSIYFKLKHFINKTGIPNQATKNRPKEKEIKPSLPRSVNLQD